MNQLIGYCSICGGRSVYGHAGAWMGTTPPPPAECTQCGAIEQKGPVIPMRPRPVTEEGPPLFPWRVPPGWLP